MYISACDDPAADVGVIGHGYPSDLSSGGMGGLRLERRVRGFMLAKLEGHLRSGSSLNRAGEEMTYFQAGRIHIV
jgi:hypothetical protein